MKVLQQLKHDKKTNEEVRTLMDDPEEIHEVIAKAQDTFRRCDKEARRNRHGNMLRGTTMWDTQHIMEMGELQIDHTTKNMQACFDGWARLEWNQITPEMLKSTRDMVTKMEEIVESKTLEQLFVASSCEHGCSCVDTEGSKPDASILGLPTDAVTCFLCNFWAGRRFVDVIRWCKTWLPKSVAGCTPENRIQECVRTVMLAMEGEEEGVVLVTVASFSGWWMEGMNEQVPEIKATTMVDDRMLYASETKNFRIFEEAIENTEM